MTPEDQFNKVCKEQFENIIKKLDKIYDRLFIDNSAPSFQTKIDRNTRWIKKVSWMLGAIYVAAVGVMVGAVAWLFKK